MYEITQFLTKPFMAHGPKMACKQLRSHLASRLSWGSTAGHHLIGEGCVIWELVMFTVSFAEGGGTNSISIYNI